MNKVVAITAILGMLLFLNPAAIQANQGTNPGDIDLVMDHRSIILDAGDERADVGISIVNNMANPLEVITELVGTPTGWNIDIWEGDFDYKVSSLVLKGESSQQLVIRIVPPGDRPDDLKHPMTLRLKNTSGTLLYKADFNVQALQGRVSALGSVSVTSTYPVLRGTPEQEFEFEVQIRNKTGAPATFNINAEVPANWEVSFRPTFGQPNQVISTVSMIQNGHRSVKVVVRPAATAAAGVYPILVTVDNDDVSSITQLQVTMTGKGELAVATGSGRLNVDAMAGEESPMVLRVVNTGTAELTNLQLNADAPTGWKILSNPSTIELLPPKAVMDVQISFVPVQEALPGDYLITLRVGNTQDTKSLDLRVTVGKSTLWGWIGIAIVILMVAGLALLFARLGRR